MGYVDLQVNGFGGVDFNQDNLSGEDLHRACAELHKEGVSAFLATVVTDDVAAMCQRLRRIVTLREQDQLIRSMIAGLHIEGPFINETAGYVGAHPPDAVIPANPDAMRRLLDAGAGLARIVTLAPERDEGMLVTKMIAEAGIVAAAGHCDPSLQQLDAAIAVGLSMFTHLGNGCPMLMHRHDNIIQRALSRNDRLLCCFIADGVHVPFFALRNYIRIAGVDRCVIVSDAMAAAGFGPGKYRLGRWEVDVGEDLAAWAPDRSHLIGSAMSLSRAHHNLIEKLNLSKSDADALTERNPTAAIDLLSPAVDR